MGAEQKTHFTVDKSKCIQCGKCINVCSGMVIELGQNGYPEIEYARGVQKDRGCKVHRYTQESKCNSMKER